MCTTRRHATCPPAHWCSVASQINVAAFATRYDVPIGSQALPEGTRWVEDVSRAELEKEYDGWGPDVAALLRCMPEKASRWAIHVVHPPLAGYARGRVALIGDAVSYLPHSAAVLHITRGDVGR